MNSMASCHGELTVSEVMFLHAEYEVRDKLGKQSDMAWT